MDINEELKNAGIIPRDMTAFKTKDEIHKAHVNTLVAIVCLRACETRLRDMLAEWPETEERAAGKDANAEDPKKLMRKPAEKRTGGSRTQVEEYEAEWALFEKLINDGLTKRRERSDI